MRVFRTLQLASALLLASAFTACAQAPDIKGFEPDVGQEGKDVVWVPTPQNLVEKMLDLAKVTPRDIVMDLGSGDGRTVIAAAKRGAQALGVEFDPHLVEYSRQNARAAGVADRARFIQGDFFETDLSRATVITLFLLPEINVKLRPRLLELAPGTRVVANTFDMDAWKPDEMASAYTADSKCESYCSALLWIVPAKVAGTYSLPIGELALKQEFQMLTGTLRTAGTSYALEGRVRGEEVSFRAGGREYRGRMRGGKLVLD
jgi:SAM-dependent methyltransferase